MPLNVEEAFALALRRHRSGRLAEAERAYREILQVQPGHADSLHLLGVIALQTGNPEPALALIERAVALRPDGAVYRNNLGQVLERLGRIEDAASAYETAIDLDAQDAEPVNNLGRIHEEQDRHSEAEACYRQAIALNAQYAEPHNNLGNILKDRGELDDAIAAYRRAIALRPDMSMLHSNLLLTVHYHPEYGPADISREHREWAERHVVPLASERRAHGNAPEPGRRLRIAYVSPDLREHPVARFLLPLLENHDRKAFEVIAYHDNSRQDDVTKLIRTRVDRWREIADLSDEQAADTIRADRIDILVDLAAHSGRNRLLVFARKPAPVQVSYLAYCSTTGVDAIDYRLTDRFLDPSGEDERHYSERSIRLPDCYWCYSTPPLPSDSLPGSERRPGPPTFGCLNNFAKVTDPTLELWMQLLERVPEARLLLYARSGQHRERVRGFMARAGIEESRVAFVGRQPFVDYLKTWQEVDVALDPIPFGGGTTSCDALWMGVPVVTLAGRTAVSRGGSSLLANIGLDELVTRSPEQYLDWAARLIGDVEGLVALRRELRGRLESSPIMDSARFTAGVEDVFRTMWRDWCASAGQRKIEGQ